MSERSTVYSRTLLAGIVLLWVAAVVTSIALAGMAVGMVMLAILFGVPLLTAAIGQGRMPWELKRPQRNEWYLIGSFAGIAAFTIIAWLLLPPWAWVAVPIVGLWASLSLYGVNQLEPETRASRQLARLRNEGLLIPGTADTLVRRWSNMLSQVDIFKELTDEERDQVATLGNVRMVQEGDSLGIEGQEGTSVYVILEGTAQLSANSSVGRITARVAGPGESLPLASILGEGNLITSIDARTDMRVWQVDSAKLRAFFSKNPEIAAKVYYGAATVLAERYRRTLWRLTEQSAGVVKSETFWANV
jgi:hypothetical protein